MYLIESYYSSPISFFPPKPVGYVQTLKEAKAICKAKNKKAIRNKYGYTKIKNLNKSFTSIKLSNLEEYENECTGRT